MDAIADTVVNTCTPTVAIDIKPATLDGKALIALDVKSGDKTPYYVKSFGIHKGTFIRIGATSRSVEVEAWGGGVSRYFTACAASGLPPPTVSEEAGFFKVVFWRRAKDAKAIDDTSVPTIETTAKTTTKTAVKSAVKTTARTTGKVALQESQGRAGLSVWNMINKNPTIAISALASASSRAAAA